MTAEGTANIGVVGMAVMGSNLARNLASREGNSVAIFNRSFEKTQTVLDAHPEANFICLLYTSPSPRDRQKSRMPSSA